MLYRALQPSNGRNPAYEGGFNEVRDKILEGRGYIRTHEAPWGLGAAVRDYEEIKRILSLMDGVLFIYDREWEDENGDSPRHSYAVMKKRLKEFKAASLHLADHLFRVEAKRPDLANHLYDMALRCQQVSKTTDAQLKSGSRKYPPLEYRCKDNRPESGGLLLGTSLSMLEVFEADLHTFECFMAPDVTIRNAFTLQQLFLDAWNRLLNNNSDAVASELLSLYYELGKVTTLKGDVTTDRLLACDELRPRVKYYMALINVTMKDLCHTSLFSFPLIEAERALGRGRSIIMIKMASDFDNDVDPEMVKAYSRLVHANPYDTIAGYWIPGGKRNG